MATPVPPSPRHSSVPRLTGAAPPILIHLKTKVAIYDDRIEIENAGMFPEEIPANQLTYSSHILDSHTSEPPNETIARVMYYSGVIEHWGRGLSMIFEDCKRAGLRQPIVTDDRGVVRVTFMRPNISDLKNDTINDTINDNEKMIYNRIISSPGISAVALANEFGKSIITIKRALKTLIDLNKIEYRGSKKKGGYFNL